MLLSSKVEDIQPTGFSDSANAHLLSDTLHVYRVLFSGRDGSKRVLEKAGFTVEGVQRRVGLKPAQWIEPVGPKSDDDRLREKR